MDLLPRVMKMYFLMNCAFSCLILGLCKGGGWIVWDVSICEFISPLPCKGFSTRDIFSNTLIKIIRVWINLLNIFTQQCVAVIVLRMVGKTRFSVMGVSDEINAGKEVRLLAHKTYCPSFQFC